MLNSKKLFNETVFGLKNGFGTPLERIACPDQMVLVHVDHHAHDGFQQVYAVVKLLIGLTINNSSTIIIKGIQNRSDMTEDSQSVTLGSSCGMKQNPAETCVIISSIQGFINMS